MASSLPDHSIAELSVPIAARKLSPLGLVGTLIGASRTTTGRCTRSSHARSTSRERRRERPRRRSPAGSTEARA
jgi:hypothetical protein